MKNKVVQLLNQHGPMLSGELARHYESKYNVSNEAARQALSRAGLPVCKISKLSFDKNQKFFYLENQFMSNRYTDALLNAIEEHSKINSIYITAFTAQNGCVSKKLLPAFVSAPVGNVKGHKLHKRVIEDLLKQKIIQEFDETRWTLAPAFNNRKRPNISRAAGLEVAKRQIVHDFASWIGKMNLSAYNSISILDEKAQFANFQWAYTAPSYVHSLYDMKKNRPGFVVADVFYGKTATIKDIQFFIDKVNIIRSFRNLSNFLPIIIVDRINKDTLKLLKENKIMIALISNIFNNRYSQLLGDIVNLFANAAAIIFENPDKLEKLFIEIGKSEGRFNNLAGDMFELLVGHYYRDIGCSDLEMKKIIQIPGEEVQQREIDVIAKKDGRKYIVECKASRSMIDNDFAKKWLDDIIPQIYKWILKQDWETNKYTFQLWSLGGFTKKAEELLRLRQKSVKPTKYRIEFFNREEMRNIAKENNSRFFLSVIDQHFDIKIPNNT